MVADKTQLAVNWRKEKRWERKQAGRSAAVHTAYLAGQYWAFREKPYRNPFPPGKRYQEFERAYFLLAEEGKIELFRNFHF